MIAREVNNPVEYMVAKKMLTTVEELLDNNLRTWFYNARSVIRLVSF